jgi:hypothetical protein
MQVNTIRGEIPLTETRSLPIACFVTPHGYGHAARAAAVMNAIRQARPEAFFHIFTRVPAWFFQMSLRDGFTMHDALTDIGLVQATSMDEDLAETIRRLDALLPFREETVCALAGAIRREGCRLVLCDIAPLGIAAARAAGVPSFLVENFTWDWIYEGYLEQEPRFEPYMAFLREAFAAADFHIRTEPACTETPPADLTTHVVSRKPRQPREATRARLNVAKDAPLVMVTMGGIVTEYPFLDRLERSQYARFLIPGGSDAYQQRGSLVLIPHHSTFYHPDLVEASDAIVGKLGYSTLAEAYAAGLPYAYIPRERFPESRPMGAYAREVMGAMELSEAQFFNGAWMDLLPDLLARPHGRPAGPNGADEIAAFVLERT